MAMYAITTIPLIQKLSESSNSTQLWYTDDATAGGSLVDLKQWWDVLNLHDPSYGYLPNAIKTTLLVKESMLPELGS